MWITIIIFLLFVKLSVSSLVGSCNQCFAANKVACMNETHFATCFKGLPSEIITKCPANRFCTDDVHICRTSAEGYTPICYHNDYCGECETSKGSFTCLDETTYGNCYGGTIPLESSFRSCPQGYVCNYNYREICVPAATNVPACKNKTTSTTGISTTSTEFVNDDITSETTTDKTLMDQTTTTLEMSSETTTEIPFITTPTQITTTITVESPTSTETTTEITTSPTTTTQAERRDADTVCGEFRRTGYLQTNDPTCRQYVYCYLLSGQYLGLFYYCNGYFNAAIQKCQTERPLNCVEY